MYGNLIFLLELDQIIVLEVRETLANSLFMLPYQQLFSAAHEAEASLIISIAHSPNQMWQMQDNTACRPLAFICKVCNF